MVITYATKEKESWCWFTFTGKCRGCYQIRIWGYLWGSQLLFLNFNDSTRISCYNYLRIDFWVQLKYFFYYKQKKIVFAAPSFAYGLLNEKCLWFLLHGILPRWQWENGFTFLPVISSSYNWNGKIMLMMIKIAKTIMLATFIILWNQMWLCM